MNTNINETLFWLKEILRMNGENVKSIEAVEDWYDNGQYMKEVAEITYENGAKRYADIGCDSNLAAVYDIMAVMCDIKPRSQAIGEIKRDIYPKHEVPKRRSEREIIEDYEREKAFAVVFGY